MPMKKIKKIILKVFTFALIFGLAISSVQAVSIINVTPSVLKKITLEATDYLIIDADKDYVCIKENIFSKNKTKITVLHKKTYEFKKSYYLPYFSDWKGNLGDTVTDSRYWAVSKVTSDQKYEYFILDLITGKLVKIIDKSIEIDTPINTLLNVSPGSDTALYCSSSNRFGFIKLSTGQTVKDVTPVIVRNPEQDRKNWSENGKYTVFYKDNILYLLDAVTMKQTEVSENGGTDAFFLDWLPNNSGFVYLSDKKVRLYFFKNNDVQDTEITLAEIPQNQYYTEMINWNKAKNKFAICTNNRVYYYDLKAHKKEETDISSDYTALTKKYSSQELAVEDLIWAPDDKMIGVIGFRLSNIDVLDEMLVWNGKKYINLSGAKRPSYYKHYLLYYSDIELVGNSSTIQNSLKVLDLNTMKLYTFNNVKSAEITPDGSKIIAYDSSGKYDFNLKAHIVDESKYKLGNTIAELKYNAYSDGYITGPNGGNYCKGSRIFCSSTFDTYQVFSYSKMKSETILKFSKNQIDKLDWYQTEKNGFFIWNNKLKSMYAYTDGRLIKFNVNRSVDCQRSYKLLFDQDKTVFIFNEKSTKNLCFYQLKWNG